MPTWNYKEITIYYKVIGSGEPVLFIHGWGHTHATFMGIADILKNKIKSYVLDLPGFGASTRPKDVWGSHDYAEAVLSLCKAIIPGKFSIVGHSFGGKISIITANIAKKSVKKLVLIDSSGIRPPMTLSKFVKIYLFKSAKIIHNSKLLPGIGDKIYNKIMKFSGSTDYLNAGEMREILKKIVREDVTDKMKTIQCPTLLLWGEDDTATPIENAHKIKSLIPNSELITFPHIGHLLPLESPHQVAHQIGEFLSKE
jgi:pimeloyl-ACP methyl ester carboxylesterase